MACRDTKKADGARRDIVADTHNDNIVIKKLDLGSLAPVKEFADDFNNSKTLIITETMFTLRSTETTTPTD